MLYAFIPQIGLVTFEIYNLNIYFKNNFKYMKI